MQTSVQRYLSRVTHLAHPMNSYQVSRFTHVALINNNLFLKKRVLKKRKYCERFDFEHNWTAPLGLSLRPGLLHRHIPPCRGGFALGRILLTGPTRKTDEPENGLAEKWTGRPPVLSFRHTSRHVQKCLRQVYIKVFNDHTALVTLFMVTSVQER